MMVGCPMRLKVKGDRHHFSNAVTYRLPLGDDEAENVEEHGSLWGGGNEEACEDLGHLS